MNLVLDKIRSFWNDKDLRSKFLFTILILTIYRVFAFTPVSGIDRTQLEALFSGSQFLSLLDIFSGGTLLNFSIMALGLNPYINASIIMQLLTVAVPQLEQLSKEGEQGRKKINQYTRILTLPLTLVQAIGIYVFLQSQGIIADLTLLEFISFITTIVAGTFVLIWFGEMISEFGLGNGISMIIFAGIVGRLPVFIGQSFATITRETVINMLIFIGLGLVVIAGVVYINQALRKIPIYYAKRIKGNRMYQGATNYLPLKLNQAGVIPIIFAVSFVLFPQLVGNFFTTSTNEIVRNIAVTVVNLFDPLGFFYNAIYFVLVVAFTFFYTIVVFNPQKISDDIQKNGGFIPGIRPGSATKNYLQNVLYRLTTVGALFLGLIAILPVIISVIAGIPNLVLGGTGILIVVSVILETFKLIESQMVMKSYDRYSL